MRTLIAFLLLTTPALAQQPQQMIPLTDWRAQLDYQLGKIPMSREAHGDVIRILQEWEKQEQAKAHEPAAGTVLKPFKPEKEKVPGQ